MTHQEIIDRIEALSVEQSKAYRDATAVINKERESLQELCGGLGHMFANQRSLYSLGCVGRKCLYCGKSED